LKLVLPSTNLCKRKHLFASMLCTRWKNSTRRMLVALSAVLVSALLTSATVYAATNSAIGGFNGINNGTIANGDGTGAARIEINSVQLALVKEARDLAGTVLADNADVNPGQEIYFVLYVDNLTDVAAYRMTIQDAIDETQFTYVADSLETTSVASGADAATRWAGLWTPLTDALGGPDDEASILDTGGPPDPDLLTVGDVSGQANLFLQIAAQTQWAIRFRVRVD
jgi:uncharacterized repeat protein (TIGR01451 family)